MTAKFRILSSDLIQLVKTDYHFTTEIGEALNNEIFTILARNQLNGEKFREFVI